MAKKKDSQEAEEQAAVEAALASLPEVRVHPRFNYCPTERDHEVYRTHARLLSVVETAKAMNVSERYVRQRLVLVRAWINDKFIDDAAEIRAQHLSLFQQHYAELRELWDVSIKRGKNDSKYERLERPIQIIKEMREVLKTIAAYTGVLKVTESDGADDTDDRVAGIPRAAYITQQIVKLQVQLGREQEMDSERAKRTIVGGSS